MLKLLQRAFRDFNEDECPVRAAALAYYTIFALPPLLVLLLMIAGAVWDPQDVQRSMETQFASLVGTDNGQAIHAMLSGARKSGGAGIAATILGTAGLLLGAIGVFMQLQGTLNRVWEVKPDPKRGGLKNFIGKRFLSLGMLLGVAFLMIVSLAMSAVVSALGERLTFFPEPALHTVDFVLSFGVMTVLFAAIFKILPDAEVKWRDVWVGALVTSVLFVVGKFAIGLYLGRSDPGRAFGAAGALAVILVWIYYAGMIVLFGAEFTQAWADRAGRKIRPEKGAVSADAAKAPASWRTDSRSEESEAEFPRGRRAVMEDREYDRARRLTMTDGRNGSRALAVEDASIGELFKRLTADSSHLVREEVNLAKTELRESARRVAQTATKLGIAIGLAIPGMLALVAFLVIALGDAMNNYWASALIVGVVLVAVAGMLAKRAMSAVKERALGAPQTAATLREDAEWAKEEVREFKRELTA